ncbi:major facilitator superfamily domain-containing protein [Neohortaea acidophila]|uniref:Major facilitator superfamily domain-containing protein n=1 Tax=Neohortaea acidophila TaxID=245834 RepID=A0A6A6PIA4_9PEZI|nr:major facilitator superfamily domain-containing protein [Neohortaea acidophila]KAF2479253.1 major facilitator superfamily domain-containing protein [Neohortaea acidophila]
MASSKARHTTVTAREYAGSDETTPLLPSSTPIPKLISKASPRTLIILVIVVILLASCGDQLMESPQTRIFESVICYRYYEATDPSKLLVGREAVGPGAIGGVAEMWCKVSPVQSKVASLRGWQFTLEGIPSLLLALPAGWAADTIGRKPVAILGLLAFPLRAAWMQLVTFFWQAFDVRMSWISAVFASIGGGSTALTSVMYVIVSDITTEANRANVFVLLSGFNLLAALFMPPLAALLMETNPWIACLAGTCLQLLAIPTFLFFPETLNYNHSPPPPIVPEPTTAPHGNHADSPAPPPGFWRALPTRSKNATAFLTRDWRILALTAPFPFLFLGGNATQLLIQYVSARYEIKLSKAILITTIRMIVVTIILFAGLPLLSKLLLRKYAFSPRRKDLNLGRLSLLFGALGWILCGFAPTIPVVIVALTISALGVGSVPMLRSFITSIVEKQHIARVYAIITVLDTLGGMAGSPVMAKLFSRGFALGGYWTGLPFYFLGSMTGACAVLIFGVNLRKGEDVCAVQDSEEEEEEAREEEVPTV